MQQKKQKILNERKRIEVEPKLDENEPKTNVNEESQLINKKLINYDPNNFQNFNNEENIIDQPNIAVNDYNYPLEQNYYYNLENNIPDYSMRDLNNYDYDEYYSSPFSLIDFLQSSWNLPNELDLYFEENPNIDFYFNDLP